MKALFLTATTEMLDNKDFRMFLQGYLDAALWSSTDENEAPLDDNYDDGDFSHKAIVRMTADCLGFYTECYRIYSGRRVSSGDVACDSAMAGHDFWLTRCGHGCGFWDGDWHKDVSEYLSSVARRYGNINLYIGDDGLIYC